MFKSVQVSKKGQWRTGKTRKEDCGCVWEEWTDGTETWEIKIYDCRKHPDSGD